MKILKCYVNGPHIIDAEKEIERLRGDIKMAIGLLSHPEDIETTKKVQQALLWTLRGGQNA